MSFLRMNSTLLTGAFVLSAALIATPAMASRTHRAHATTGHARLTHKGKAKPQHRVHGQQAIDPDRVTEIQQALVRTHYLATEPDGRWDATTEAAMQKFQADNGWQTKLMPDSRAILKLGLGPDYSNAINAKNSSFAAPIAAAPIPSAQSDGFLQASGVSH